MKDLDRLPNRSPDVDPLPGPYIATIKAEIHDLVQAFTDISVLLRELPQQISWISQSADEGTRRWAWPSGHFRNCAGEQPGPAILLCQVCSIKRQVLLPTYRH